MKRTITSISKTIMAVAAATLLSAGLSIRAAVISVNLTPYTTDGANIDADETFGIASQGTVAGGWFNFNRSGGDNTQGLLTTANLPISDGTPTTVGMTLTAPNSWATGFNGAYADTPLNQGLDDYTATPSPTSIILTNLNANFPNGYKVIAYVGGFNANRGASISDGTTTFYYRVDPAPVSPYGNFVQTTQTTDLGATNNPIAQYAVFGDSILLTSDTLTLTLDTLYNGGAGLCGVQIVGASANELLARIWRGNLSSDWDTIALNWTNNFFGTTNFADGDPVFFTDAAEAANPTVNLTAPRSPGSVTVDSSKNFTFTGSGIAGSAGLTKKGDGSLTLSNPNTYLGDTTVTAGTLRIGASGSVPDGVGAGNVSVALGATLDLNGNNEAINGLSGLGTVDNTGGAAALTVGLNDAGGAFPGTFQGAVSLIKQGTNSLTLSGFSSHSGATIVGQGALVLNPLSAFSASSALVVSNGANLEVSFTNGGGIFTPANVGFNGGVALIVDYGDASLTGFGTPITTSGALNLSGVTQFGIRGLNFGTGTFTIISYGTKTGAGSISSTPAFLPSGMVATIQDTGSAINLVVTTPSIQNLLWTQGDGEWSTNGFFNWNFGTAEYKEYPSGFGDSVSFDNSNFGTVNLPHDVKPFTVTLAGNYVLTGPGRITGATGVQRSGFSGTTFILDNANTYTGVTTVNAGTLQINNASALGSAVAGTVVASGGSLALSNGITMSGEPITLNGNGTASNNGALRTVDTNSPITLASPITLGSTARIRAADGGQLIITSPITDNGSNFTMFLHAAQTNTVVQLNSASNAAANLTVYGVNTNQGTIRFGVNYVFPASTLTVGGGRFDLNGTAQVFAGLLAGFDPTFGRITNSSGTPATLTINYNGTNTAQMQSALAGAVNVVKQGSGVQSFAGGVNLKHNYSGTTTINEGVLGIASDFSGVTGSFLVNSGGTLRGSGQAIGGPVTVQAGGTFHAGFTANQIGTLTINNNLSLAGDFIAAINKDVAPSNDVVNVTGTLTYGGTLIVTNIGTNALVVGDAFPIFPAGGTGTFSAIVNPPGATFAFTDGVLTVVSVAAGPTLDYTALGGGAFQLSWSGPYVLQWQTNALNTGLSDNWSDYPDASNPVNVTVNPAIPSAFFRLRSQ
jgi:autotransporter-associated beta strand protein